MTGRVHIEDLGMRDYKETWDLQESIFQDIVQRKIVRRNAGLAPRIQALQMPQTWPCPNPECFGWSIPMC